MNNVVMRKVIVTGSYQPLSAISVVASVEISASPSNTGPVFFQGDDGSDVEYIAGEFHWLDRVNLAELLIRGNPGDVVTLVGTAGD